MPYDDPDPTDPMTLNGVMFETEDEGAMREMTVCFVEEFFRSGYGPERIMALFALPEYAGPHLAYRALGESAVREIVESLAPMWLYRSAAPSKPLSWGGSDGACIYVQTDGRTGNVRLPVLQ